MSPENRNQESGKVDPEPETCDHKPEKSDLKPEKSDQGPGKRDPDPEKRDPEPRQGGLKEGKAVSKQEMDWIITPKKHLRLHDVSFNRQVILFVIVVFLLIQAVFGYLPFKVSIDLKDVETEKGDESFHVKFVFSNQAIFPAKDVVIVIEVFVPNESMDTLTEWPWDDLVFGIVYGPEELPKFSDTPYELSRSFSFGILYTFRATVSWKGGDGAVFGGSFLVKE